MNVQLDLKAIERLITRSCRSALTEFGFDMEDDAPPLEFSFAWNEDNDCVGIDITQAERERLKRTLRVDFPPARGPVQ